MIIRDMNGLQLNVEDGDGLTIWSRIGTSFTGTVMTFKESAWLKVRGHTPWGRSTGTVDLLTFSRHSFTRPPVRSTGIYHFNTPRTELPTAPPRSPDDWRNSHEPKWELGACYEHPLQTQSYLKLVHMAGQWLTFEKYAKEGAYGKQEGQLIGVHTARESEKINLNMTTPAPKQYDPTQQPFTEDDI